MKCFLKLELREGSFSFLTAASMKGITIGSVALTLFFSAIQWAVVDAEIVELTPSNYDALAKSGTWYAYSYTHGIPTAYTAYLTDNILFDRSGS